MIVPTAPHATGHGGMREVFRFLVRRRWLIGFPLAICMVIAGLAYIGTPPRYIADAVVALNVRTTAIVPLDAVLSRLPQENPVLRTEMDVISSRSMADKVIEGLSPETIAALRAPPSTMLARTLKSFREQLGLVAQAGEPDQAHPPILSESAREALINEMLSRLSVTNDGRSYTIYISYTATTPQLAAEMANAYAGAYLSFQKLQQVAAIRTASTWLAGRLDELRAQLEASERAVETFRQSSGLLEDSEGGTIQTQRLSALNAELVRARSARASAEARLVTATQLAEQADGLNALGDVLGSPIILSLRQQQATLARDIAALEDAGAVNNARLPGMKSQLASLNNQIEHEIQRVRDSLANEVSVAQRKEDELERAFADMVSVSGEGNRAAVKLKQLQREANANRAIYESFLSRYKETIEQEGLVAPEGRLISSAQPPRGAASPRPLSYALLGLFFGAASGLGLAFMAERMDDRVHGARRLESETGLRVLGVVPALPWISSAKAASYGIKHPTSPYAEALRRLHAMLRLSQDLRGARVITLTSAVPGEGKTSLCVSLARTIASAGKRVIVVDADLHRPSVAAAFGASSAASHLRAGKPETGRPVVYLDDVLQGGQSLDDAIRPDALSPAHFIAVQPYSSHSQTLLGAGSFQAVLEKLRQRYDLVLVDTPPVMACADAALVGSVSDATLLVVRWHSDLKELATEAVRQLALCAVPVSALVITRVDLDRYSRYEAGAARSYNLDIRGHRRDRPKMIDVTALAHGHDGKASPGSAQTMPDGREGR